MRKNIMRNVDLTLAELDLTIFPVTLFERFSFSIFLIKTHWSRIKLI